MEERLNRVVLSLKQMALRKVIAHLLNDPDVVAPISRFIHNIHEIKQIENEWQETVEPKVKVKVLVLNLPKSLMNEMIEMVRPIGLQIKRWKDRQEYHFRDETEEIVLPDASKLCWTAAGLIDYRKTAKELVRCDDLDLVLRYKLACFNCLEDDIPLLWQKLPEEKKLYFYNTVCNQEHPRPHLHFCWPHILKGKISNLDYLWMTNEDFRDLTSFNQWAFEEAARKGNKMATEYFFQKLRPGERLYSMMRTARYLNFVMFQYLKSSDEFHEVFFYLLSVMTPEQRFEMFSFEQLLPLSSTSKLQSVSCFLDWPWPDLFLEDIRNFWSLIPPGSYGRVYWVMLCKFENSNSHISKLFPELFEQSPLDFKRRFVELECCSYSCRFLCLLLESGDSKGIQAIFRNIVGSDRERLVFQPHIFASLEKSLLVGKWRIVETCLQEARLLDDQKMNLKETFRRLHDRFGGKEWNKLKFERIFERIDQEKMAKRKDQKTLRARSDARPNQETMAKKHQLKDCHV